MVNLGKSEIMDFVYLLHFDRPISDKHTTQHYIGYASDIVKRLNCHKSGNGARLTEIAKIRNIGFALVRLWHGDRNFERKLKNRKNAPKLCPICSNGQGNFDNEILINLEDIDHE